MIIIKGVFAWSVLCLLVFGWDMQTSRAQRDLERMTMERDRARDEARRHVPKIKSSQFSPFASDNVFNHIPGKENDKRFYILFLTEKYSINFVMTWPSSQISYHQRICNNVKRANKFVCVYTLPRLHYQNNNQKTITGKAMIASMLSALE